MLHRIALSVVLLYASYAAAQPPLVDPIPDPIAISPIQVGLVPFDAGFTLPLEYHTLAPDGSRALLADYDGTIYLYENGQRAATPALDVSGRIIPSGTFGFIEPGGLRSIATHPDFNNVGSEGYGKIYTFTQELTGGTADFPSPVPAVHHQNVVAEWRFDSANPSVIDAASRREILRYDQPELEHNGGDMVFGDDALLYVSTGDGAFGSDSLNLAQTTDDILGAILRIDVDSRTSANGQYGIPSDNPFVGIDGLDEIYAYGLRQPFRMNKDRDSSTIVIADVGQDNIEEVNLLEPGANFGWSIKEGTFLTDPTKDFVLENSPGLPVDLVDPVLQYDHGEGRQIVGGFIYRGSEIPELFGKYIFGDALGSFFSGDLATGEILQIGHLHDFVSPGGSSDQLLFLQSFAEDEAGELLVMYSRIESQGYLPIAGTGGVARLTVVPEASSILLCGIAFVFAVSGIYLRRASSRRPNLAFPRSY